ncbi:hypothetical protein JCM21900_005211 [Sporobolomyces salmonicolor]
MQTPDKEYDIEHAENSSVATGLKLDPHGLPLVPQPTSSASDPLNWPFWLKVFITVQVGLLSFFGSMALGVMNPAYALIGESIGKSVVQASYIGTVSIAAAGLGSFVWAPLGQLITGRFFVGFGLASSNVISFAIVSDVWHLHERGRALGAVTVLLINGPHVASLPGGLIAQYVNWRWTMYLPAIFNASMWLVILFCLPETLFVRTIDHPIEKRPILARLALFRRPQRKLRLASFARPFQMLAYTPVVIVGLYAGIVFTFGSVLPAQSWSAVAKEYYHWKSAETGISLSVTTAVGGVLGEIFSGPIIDRMMTKSRLQSGGAYAAETRLKGMVLGAFLLPVGLLIYGWTVEKYYYGACIGAAVTCFAVQVITTPAIAYVIDAYKEQSAEVVQLLNFARQEISFTTGFWGVVYGTKVGYGLAGTTYAIVSVVAFAPVVWLMFKGERLRERLGQPKFNQGL